jgi:heptosyltransferase-2
MQTDVFAFFGPTTRKFGYYPYRPKDKMFEVELACRPCGSHGSHNCPLGHFECMYKISPQWVAEEVDKKFNGEK